MFIQHFNLPKEKHTNLQIKVLLSSPVSTTAIYTEFNTVDPDLEQRLDESTQKWAGWELISFPPDCVSWVGNKILLICGAAIRRT